MTYSDMTSGGKLRGISPALSHSALSLVHIHDAGQRGCLALLLSTASKTDATTSKPSHGDLVGILSVFSILARQTALHMNQALRRASFPNRRGASAAAAAAAAAAAWRPKRRAVRSCLSPPCAFRAPPPLRRWLKTWRPVQSSALWLRYTPHTHQHQSPTPPTPVWQKHESDQMRAALRKVPAGAVTNGGVTAGGDPSGSRRSISIQNHAYDFSQRSVPRSLPGRCRPIGKGLGVNFFFFFLFFISFFWGGGGWISWRKNEALTRASGSQRVAQTHTGCLCGGKPDEDEFAHRGTTAAVSAPRDCNILPPQGGVSLIPLQS